MKFGFVPRNRRAWSGNLVCEALGVSREGIYAWLMSQGVVTTFQIKGWAPRCTGALFADGTYGATCWSRPQPCGRIASSGSCENIPSVRLPDAEACPRAEASAARWPTTYWTANSRLLHRTRSGWPTSRHLDSRRLAVRGGGAEPVLASNRGLVDAREHESEPRSPGQLGDGRASQVQ